MDDYNSLDTIDKQVVMDAINACPEGSVVNIRLREWCGAICVDSQQSMTDEDERNYLDSGGSWNYVHPDSLRDLVEGRLQ
jgi:hypothetical protein